MNVLGEVVRCRGALFKPLGRNFGDILVHWRTGSQREDNNCQQQARRSVVHVVTCKASIWIWPDSNRTIQGDGPCPRSTLALGLCLLSFSNVLGYEDFRQKWSGLCLRNINTSTMIRNLKSDHALSNQVVWPSLVGSVAAWVGSRRRACIKHNRASARRVVDARRAEDSLRKRARATPPRNTPCLRCNQLTTYYKRARGNKTYCGNKVPCSVGSCTFMVDCLKVGAKCFRDH